jgi:hypothetical protein
MHYQFFPLTANIYDFLNKAQGRLLFVLNMGDPIRLMQ